jgi:CRP-like cAMP-binding protein
MSLIELLENSEVKEGTQWVMKNYQKNQVIVEEDSPGSELFLIYKGSVNILSTMKITTENQQKKRIAQLNQGDCFGEMAIFGEDLRSATVVAATECELIMIDSRLLLSFMDENPEKGYHLLRYFFESLVQKMRNNNERANAIMGFYLREIS